MAVFRSVAPILPTSDMVRTRRHYECLGFAVTVHGDGYATAARDGVALHFELVTDQVADSAWRPGGAVYIGVDDADALHAEWVAAGVGTTDDLHDPGFGVWEAAHTDPDGNIVRFGSPLSPHER
ncbi:MAG TPA: VOC family protein [Acidimicrobiales bacterium]|nr:VOC family protein [Acidimicrobiales bacterium]